MRDRATEQPPQEQRGEDDGGAARGRVARGDAWGWREDVASQANALIFTQSLFLIYVSVINLFSLFLA
jgi:hypothetical protein